MSSTSGAAPPNGRSRGPANTMPLTTRTLPRGNVLPGSHPNRAMSGGMGDEWPASFGVRLARMLTASGAPSVNTGDFADYADIADRLAFLRLRYFLPSKFVVWPHEYRKKMTTAGQMIKDEDEDEDSVYMAGNSLGCMPRRTPEALNAELSVWKTHAVLAHVEHPLGHPWVEIDELVTATLAEIVGAHRSEVACMGSLTANLHALFTSFYKPTPRRHKIMYEGKAFPSDAYAFASQIALHDYPASSLLPVDPLPGEYILRTKEILRIIEEEGDSIAIICFGAVQYYSGQYFDIPAITAAGHAKGCLVAFDCAHAVGNVPLELHDWGVDFAAWCSYKYLNAGPGAIAGIFVHKRHEDHARLQGWWGHDPATRFAMPSNFSPIPGAAGWQLSNPSVIDVISLNTSLGTFRDASLVLPSALMGGHISADRGPILGSLREKSVELTSYLEVLLKGDPHYVPLAKLGTTPLGDRAQFTIITPEDPAARGAQLSLLFYPEESMDLIFEGLREGGVLGDERKPGVIRLSPVPLYNTWRDCWRAASELNRVLKAYPDVVQGRRKRAELLELATRKGEERERRKAAGEAVDDWGSEDGSPVEGTRRSERLLAEGEEIQLGSLMERLSTEPKGNGELRAFLAKETRAAAADAAVE